MNQDLLEQKSENQSLAETERHHNKKKAKTAVKEKKATKEEKKDEPKEQLTSK